MKAATVLNGRMDAAVGANEHDRMVRTGSITLTENGITGPGMGTLFAVYGDLFDITETLDDAGFGGLVQAHLADVEAGEDEMDSALCAVALQGIAFGVLMERLRWEARR